MSTFDDFMIDEQVKRGAELEAMRERAEKAERALSASEAALTQSQENEMIVSGRLSMAEAKLSAAERDAIEKCAKVCEGWGLKIGDKFYPTGSRNCATALRALTAKGEATK